MGINTRPSQSSVNRTSVGFEVDGLTMRVTPGDIIFGGKILTLSEPFEHVVVPIADNHLYIAFYVVENKATGQLELVVDEVPGGATTYNFSASTSPYISKSCLVLSGKIPAAAASLDSIEMTFRPINHVELPPTAPTGVPN